MLWLAVHIWSLLFAAFAIGIGVGWWIWGGRQSQKKAQRKQSRRLAREPAMGTLNSDFEPPADDNDASGAERRQS